MPARTFEFFRTESGCAFKIEALDLINDADAAVLRRLSRGFVIEIGTHLGASTEALLEGAAEHVMCIDTFRGTPGDFCTGTVVPEVALSILQKRFERFPGRFTIVQGESKHVAGLLRDGICDAVFIDAAHDYRSVLGDIKAWWPKIKDGGVMIGHDYDCKPTWLNVDDGKQNDVNGHHPGVVRAVVESFGESVVLAGGESCVWYVNKQKQEKAVA